MQYLKNTDVILFQGDSITDGNRGRTEDPNHILGHGYQYLLACDMACENIDVNATFINRGISGHRISDLYGRWKEDALLLKPTVLSILVGVNDVGFEYDHGLPADPQRFERIFRLLLEDSLAENQELLLVIMEPFFGLLDDSERSLFFDTRTRVLAGICKDLAEEYHAVWGPLQDMFDSYIGKIPTKQLLWDGVHPTFIGHGLVAANWKKYVYPCLLYTSPSPRD